MFGRYSYTCLFDFVCCVVDRFGWANCGAKNIIILYCVDGELRHLINFQFILVVPYINFQLTYGCLECFSWVLSFAEQLLLNFCIWQISYECVWCYSFFSFCKAAIFCQFLKYAVNLFNSFNLLFFFSWKKRYLWNVVLRDLMKNVSLSFHNSNVISLITEKVFFYSNFVAPRARCSNGGERLIFYRKVPKLVTTEIFGFKYNLTGELQARLELSLHCFVVSFCGLNGIIDGFLVIWLCWKGYICGFCTM